MYELILISENNRARPKATSIIPWAMQTKANQPIQEACEDRNFEFEQHSSKSWTDFPLPDEQTAGSSDPGNPLAPQPPGPTQSWAWGPQFHFEPQIKSQIQNELGLANMVPPRTATPRSLRLVPWPPSTPPLPSIAARRPATPGRLAVLTRRGPCGFPPYSSRRLVIVFLPSTWIPTWIQYMFVTGDRYVLCSFYNTTIGGASSSR
jgi:hypothetical protein